MLETYVHSMYLKKRKKFPLKVKKGQEFSNQYY